MGKKRYFVVGNIYIWLIVVPILLDEKNSFFIPKNNGTETKHSSKNLSICVIVVGLGNIVGCKLLDEN
jgi:hypothetical protein